MLGRHPALYAFPELVLFATESMTSRRPPDLQTSGLLRAIAELLYEGQTDSAVAKAELWVDRRRMWPVADIFDELLRLASPRTGVEKSPANTFADDHLNRICRLYPRARFLHLVRHPVATASSIIRLSVYNAECNGTSVPSNLPVRAFRTWYDVHRRILVVLNNLPDERKLRMRGEEILGDPEGALPRITDWLQIEGTDATIELMKHPEDSPYARLGPPSALLGNDWGFLMRPKIRKPGELTSLTPPEDWQIPERLANAAFRLATHFGYRDPTPATRT
jgi:hypothetical protein